MAGNYDIDGFVTHMGKRGGVAKGNEFVVFIDVSKGVVDGKGKDLAVATGIGANDLALQVQSVELPTKALLTKEIFTQNIPNPMGYNLQYSDLTINFLLDADTNGMTIWSFFNSWLNMIVNPVTAYVGYKANYSCPIYVATIRQTDKLPRNVDSSFGASGNAQHKPVSVKFHDCFPKTLGQAALDYSASDAIKFPVTFAIRSFEDHRWDTSIVPRGATNSVVGSNQ